MKKMIIDRLLAGETIEDHREGGNSMRPVIKHRQPVTLSPILDVDGLRVGDIVLVRVKGNTYTHFIKATKDDEVLIGNNHGKLNGWTPKTKVFGIVTAIDGVSRRNSQHRS